MRINFFSDIHLEFGAAEIPVNDADIVIAAGDIGLNLQGLEWLNKIGKPVVYVAGNHEFYDHNYTEVITRLKHHAHGTNVNFLERDVFYHKNIRFIGCTLWADLHIEGEEKVTILAKSLNDFKRISYADGAFKPEIFSEIYAQSILWREAELSKSFDGETIIITHHAPTAWSWNRAPNAIKRLAYCNDLKFLLHSYPVVAWFHGHVHNVVDYRIAGARILCNPRGYFGRKLVNDFDVNKVVEVS